jgi:hypothetical protein
MTERPRPIDLASRFNVTKQAINKFITQGMPIDSIESAEAWYMARRATSSGGSQVRPDRDFTETVEKQRELKALAYGQYMADLQSGSPDASKSYSTYDKLVKTLVSLEKELQAREIASREYIRTQTAIERFGRVCAQVREEVNQLGTKLAFKVNPDNPGRALKVIDDETKKMLERLSGAAVYAEVAVKDGDDVEPIEVEEENPDETVDEVQTDED